MQHTAVYRGGASGKEENKGPDKCYNLRCSYTLLVRFLLRRCICSGSHHAPCPYSSRSYRMGHMSRPSARKPIASTRISPKRY